MIIKVKTSMLLVALIFWLLSCKNEGESSNNTKHHVEMNGELAFQTRCSSCHHFFAGKQGTVFPSLADLKNMDSTQRKKVVIEFSRDSVHAFITSKLSNDEINAISDYLYSLPYYSEFNKDSIR